MLELHDIPVAHACPEIMVRGCIGIVLGLITFKVSLDCSDEGTTITLKKTEG